MVLKYSVRRSVPIDAGYRASVIICIQRFGCSGGGNLAIPDARGFQWSFSLIADMGRENRTWGEERIAAELLPKLGISLLPRTVRRELHRPRLVCPG